MESRKSSNPLTQSNAKATFQQQTLVISFFDQTTNYEGTTPNNPNISLALLEVKEKTHD